MSKRLVALGDSVKTVHGIDGIIVGSGRSNFTNEWWVRLENSKHELFDCLVSDLVDCEFVQYIDEENLNE